MITAVFDTNVVVAGVLSPHGTPGRLLDAVLDGECQPVVTDRILEEYETVLSRPKFRFPSSGIHFLMEAIRLRAVVAPFVSFSPVGILPDPDDIIFLEAAVSLHVPIVTGNAKHFPKALVGPIPVLSPAAFLARLCA